MNRTILLAIAATTMTSSAVASPRTPGLLPAGYDQAYRSFVAALPPQAREMSWLTEFDGVASAPRPLSLAGTKVEYLFACKSHYCDTDNVNLFFLPDKSSFRAVVQIGGKQLLLGGADREELQCVQKLDSTGGAAESC